MIVGRTNFAPIHDTEFDSDIPETKTEDVFGLNEIDWAEPDSYLSEVKTLYSTYKKKNHDYGNSFDTQCDEFGITAAVIRMNDKLSRLKTLCKSEAEVAESILDTVEDLANYSIMTAMWLKKDKDDTTSNKSKGIISE